MAANRVSSTHSLRGQDGGLDFEHGVRAEKKVQAVWSQLSAGSSKGRRDSRPPLVENMESMASIE